MTIEIGPNLTQALIAIALSLLGAFGIWMLR